MYKYKRNHLPIKKAPLFIKTIHVFSGKITYGIDEKEAIKFMEILNKIKEEDNEPIIDLTGLDRWDSLGVSILFRELKGVKKIKFIVRKDADVYQAIGDWANDKKDIPPYEVIAPSIEAIELRLKNE